MTRPLARFTILYHIEPIRSERQHIKIVGSTVFTNEGVPMRVIVSAVLTAVLLFIVGFVWWGMLMPMVRPAEVISDKAVVDALSDGLKDSGLHIYPDYGDPEAHGSGPMVFTYFFTDPPNMGAMMGSGFAHMFVCALLASMVVSIAMPKSFSQRFLIVFFLGLFVALWADIGNMIWWRYPSVWTAFHFGYDVLSWAVAGLSIATIVRPCSKSKQATPEE